MWVANACSFYKLLRVMIWYKQNLLWLCSERDLTSEDFIFKKMLKFKSSSMIKNTYQGYMTTYTCKTLVICYLLLHWALSNCLWPLLRFSSCAHDQDTCIPTNKTIDSYIESYAKHVIPPTKIITPFIYLESLFLKFHMPKRKYRLC